MINSFKYEDTLWTKIKRWYRRKLSGLYDFWYGRITRKHWLIKTKLPKTAWHDSDKRILYGMMAVLDDFYRDEISQDFVAWDTDPYYVSVKKEMDEIKAWWDNYENRQAEIREKLMMWSACVDRLDGDDQFSYLQGKTNEVERALSDELERMEKQLAKEEQEMLHRLINVRENMWT